MMRCLREVNVDNNTVGWRVAAAAVLFAPVRGVADALRRRFRRARYQSTYLGSYQTVELIETFLNYQARASRWAGAQRSRRRVCSRVAPRASRTTSSVACASSTTPCGPRRAPSR